MPASLAGGILVRRASPAGERRAEINIGAVAVVLILVALYATWW